MLDVSFSIYAPSGWLDLEDPANGYEAHRDTRGTRAVSWRKREISSNYVEGTFVNDAVRENVIEALAIYVRGDDPFQLDERVTALTNALEQLHYLVRARTGNLLETWSCMVAEYTIETSMEMQHATMALVRASVPRLPTVTKELVV